jgi:hypothetical protein
MQGKKQKYPCKKLRKNNVYKIILFSNPYIKNEIQTAERFAASFYFDRNPLFPFTRTLLNMYWHRPQTGVLDL